MSLTVASFPVCTAQREACDARWSIALTPVVSRLAPRSSLTLEILEGLTPAPARVRSKFDNQCKNFF